MPCSSHVHLFHIKDPMESNDYSVIFLVFGFFVVVVTFIYNNAGRHNNGGRHNNAGRHAHFKRRKQPHYRNGLKIVADIDKSYLLFIQNLQS